MPEHGAPVLFYDGSCGLCHACVRFILLRDRRSTLAFAPLASAAAKALRGRHPWLDGVDALVWVDDLGDVRRERVHVRSAAVLRVAEYLGAPWSLAGLGWLVPRVVRDAVYDLVARHRHRLTSIAACDVLPTSARHRILE